MTLLAFLLAAAAFLLLGLADRHHRALRLHPTSPRDRWRLRAAGWLLLLVSPVPAFAGQGAALGGVVWPALVMAGAALAFALLSVANGSQQR